MLTDGHFSNLPHRHSEWSEVRSLIVQYHMISCTSQLSAKHIWTLQGYVDLMRGMPINAPI